MSYVCIYSDDNASDIKIKGNALDCYANLGAAVVEAMKQIIPKMPGDLSAEHYTKMFLEIVEKQLRDYFGPLYVLAPKKKAEEPKTDQPKAAPKRPAPEEILPLILQLDNEELLKLSSMITREGAKRLREQQAAKDAGKENPAVGYAVFV